MKVLCKLRWKKIRRPFTLSVFIQSQFPPPSVFLLLALFTLRIFSTRCVSLCHILLCFLALLSFCIHPLSFSIHLLLSHHALLPLHLFLLLSCSLLSLPLHQNRFIPPLSLPQFCSFPRHSRVTFCPYLTPSNSLFTFTHVLICSLLPPFFSRCVCLCLCAYGSGGVF